MFGFPEEKGRCLGQGVYRRLYLLQLYFSVYFTRLCLFPAGRVFGFDRILSIEEARSKPKILCIER